MIAGPALVLLTGRSFSGKSTVAAALAEGLPAVVVSYDAINAERGLYGGDGVAVEQWLATNVVAHRRARDVLDDGQAVVVDDTSSPRFLRDEWRQLASDAEAAFVLVYIDVPEGVLRQRLQANRRLRMRRDMRDDVLGEHLRLFQPPGRDEPHLTLNAADTADDVVGVVARALLDVSR